MEDLNLKEKANEEIQEKIVMKDYNPGQQNLREDGEQGPTVEERDEPHQHAQGIPCQAQ